MTITSAAELFKQRGLVHRGDIGDLKGTTLAVDGHLWVKNLQHLVKEPWHMAMGGIPLSLPAVVDKELEKFKRFDIKPLFVFNGVNLQTASQTAGPDGKANNSGWVQNVGFNEYKKREKAWEYYHTNDVHQSMVDFLSAGSGMTSADTLDALIKYFRSKEVEFFRAPYLAWAQCAWFCGKHDKLCSNIWGSEEILMFIGLCQFDRLITKVEFDRQTYEYVSLAEICASLGSLTVSQFIDCCLLVGCKNNYLRGMSYTNAEENPPSSPTEELIREGYPTNVTNNPQAAALMALPSVQFAQSMRDLANVARDIITYRNGPQLLECRVRQYNLDIMYLHQVLEQFLRYKNLVIHHIILNTDCMAIPISMHNNTSPDRERNYYQNPPPGPHVKYNIVNNIVPNNLHTVIGPRLPSMVYFFLSIGLVSPQVINNVVHNTMIEYLPTIDTAEYRELLQKIVPLRTQIAYLLINCMMRKDEGYWKVAPHGGSRPIMNYIQWHTDKTIALHTPPELLLDDWAVNWADDIRDRMPRSESGLVINFVTVLPFAKCALKACMPMVQGFPPRTYTHLGEVVTVILLKSLDLLGYFTHPPQQKPFGNDESGTSLFAEALSEVHWKYAEQGVLLIELLRTGALNCLPLQNPTYSNFNAETINITTVADPRILLITRVLSILPMNLKSEEWNSMYVVRDLCAFYVLFKSLYKTLRNLCEIIMTVMFLDNRVLLAQSPDALELFRELVHRLPFHETSNTSMGVVVHYLLMQPHLQYNSPAERYAALDLANKFPGCRDVRGDLTRAFGFWIEAMKVVKKLHTGQAMQQALQQHFAEADTLLTSTFLSYGIYSPANDSPTGLAPTSAAQPPL